MEPLWMIALVGAGSFLLGFVLRGVLVPDRTGALLARTLREREETIREKDGRIERLTGELARAQAETEGAERMVREMETRFATLSRQALEGSYRRFLELAGHELDKRTERGGRELEKKEEQIRQLLAPMQESLAGVDQLVRNLDRERTRTYADMMAHLEQMQTTQRALRQETNHLVQALKKPQVRGRWGEVQLRRVVELAGMLEHCDFEEQVSRNAEGGAVRPDMTVRLPGDKMVVVDAKTPLMAFLEAVEADDEAVRAARMAEHANQVRRHIGQLSQKAYWQQFENTPEFVVMFLPGEPFFSAALERDPRLIEYGMENGVVLATPTTLIALLKSVAFGWQQEVIGQNAREISELGRELYDRIRVFTGHFSDLERALNKSVGSFNKAVQSLDRRVLPAARRFESYGIRPKQELDPPRPVERRAVETDGKSFE